MKEVMSLMDYRPTVKVLDATLRDGGLVNDFYFTDEFVRALYQTNIKAGVDYMEFGYKASKDMFDESKFGKWKFSNDDDIRAIVGENNTNLKIAVMADVGRCDYKNDIIDRSDSPIDLIRVATYVNTIPAAADMIEDAYKKGYEVSCNIMAISNSQESELKVALDILGKTSVEVFYIVDSFGSLYPEQIERLVDIYMEFAAKYGKNWESMHTTTSSLHLRIRLRRLVTALTGWMQPTQAWGVEQETAQWNCFWDFCAILSIRPIQRFSLFRTI